MWTAFIVLAILSSGESQLLSSGANKFPTEEACNASLKHNLDTMKTHLIDSVGDYGYLITGACVQNAPEEE